MLRAGENIRLQVLSSWRNLPESLEARVVRYVADGATSSVYEVEVDRQVGATDAVRSRAALKVLRTAVANVDHEVVALGNVEVDGVCRLWGLVRLPSGGTALLLAFVDGENLSEILAAAPLSTRDTLTLGKRLFEILRHLHDVPLVAGEGYLAHGDIKPGNIIVPRQGGVLQFGRATLIDFGGARIRRLYDAKYDDDGPLVGTPGYMPRGQIEGRLNDLRKSDVFAAGVVLYRCLCSSLPWRPFATDWASPRRLALELDQIMAQRGPAQIPLRQLPPWRKRGAWKRFFERVLAGGEESHIPDAKAALAWLRGVETDRAPARWLTAGVFVTGCLATSSVEGFSRWGPCPAGSARCAGVCTSIGRQGSCPISQTCQATGCGCAEKLRLVPDTRTCVDVTSNAAHCGELYRACTEKQACRKGQCVCGGRTVLCSGVCLEPKFFEDNSEHCGACGNACTSKEQCVNGNCRNKCNLGGRVECSGECVDLQSDCRHCGACDRHCRLGEYCVNGKLECREGFDRDPGGVCRDTLSDEMWCGRGPGKIRCSSTQRCSNGQCVCPPGLRALGGAICIDPTTDERSCGAAAVACAEGEVCRAGQCTCPAGFRRTASGCQRLCGGAVCPPRMVCHGDVCVSICGEGLTRCSGSCIDASSDPNNCGSCRHACATGSCVGGSCETASATEEQ